MARRTRQPQPHDDGDYRQEKEEDEEEQPPRKKTKHKPATKRKRTVVTNSSTPEAETRSSSARQRQVRERIRVAYIKKFESSEPPEPYTRESVQKLVNAEMELAKNKKFKPQEIDWMRQFIYSNSMEGSSDKRLMDEIYDKLHLKEYAAGRRDKVDQKVQNLSRTMAQFRKMVESSKLDLVATTLAKFVGVLEQREGGREAFKKARAGATLKAKEEALAKKREADKLLRDLDDLE